MVIINQGFQEMRVKLVNLEHMEINHKILLRITGFLDFISHPVFQREHSVLHIGIGRHLLDLVH
jgi:hypothetical protein